jgi:Domain of unknown function (DUF6894)
VSKIAGRLHTRSCDLLTQVSRRLLTRVRAARRVSLYRGPVPRFFFDILDDDTTIDADGLELPSSAAAIDVAHKGARDLAATQILEGHLDLWHRIIVRDERGTVAEISFRQAVAVQG